MCAAPTPNLMLTGLPKDVAGAINLSAHPLAGAMALSAVGLGLWSQAFGVWMGTASAMVEMSLRASPGLSPEPAAAPASKRTDTVVQIMMADAAQAADAAVEVVTPVETVPAKERPMKAARSNAARAKSLAAEPQPEDFRQPKGMAKPKKADDLKAISGIGPKLETVLNSLGIWTYGQIAGWTPEEIAWVDDYLAFSGRIGRDDWIGQAARLSEKKR